MALLAWVVPTEGRNGAVAVCWGDYKGGFSEVVWDPSYWGEPHDFGGVGAPLPHPGFPLGETGKGVLRYLAAS